MLRGYDKIRAPASPSACKEPGQIIMTPTRSQDPTPATEGDPPQAGDGVKDSDIATVEYIADMSLGLRDMSVRIGMPFLAYLLEMVFQEAHCASTGVGFEPSARHPVHQ